MHVQQDDEHNDAKALEALVVDNPDLERLEALLDQFNVFEAIGAVRQELRHSDFLAFLLNPRGAHGLGDAFAKRLLQRALAPLPSATAPISPIDLDVWNLDELVVLREWQSIDILLLDESHRLAVIVENKIGSGEHSNQLARYWQITAQYYPDWHIIGLYLTPDGDAPSLETYLPVDYGIVCMLLEQLAQSRTSTLGTDVLMTIRHYTQMLRRHVVAESEIAELCRRIYRKHQRALDLIYEHRPDRQASIRDMLVDVIAQLPEKLTPVASSKSYIRFAPVQWGAMAPLLTGTGWPPSKHIVAFEFANASNYVRLRLTIGPGPQVTRQQLFDLAVHHQPPFKPSSQTLYPLWTAIYSRTILTAKDYGAGDEELRAEIHKHWTKFLEDDFPAIVDAVTSAPWTS